MLLEAGLAHASAIGGRARGRAGHAVAKSGAGIWGRAASPSSLVTATGPLSVAATASGMMTQRSPVPDHGDGPFSQKAEGPDAHRGYVVEARSGAGGTKPVGMM